MPGDVGRTRAVVAHLTMAAVGEIRQNPGGRRVLLLGVRPYDDTARGPLWRTVQINGRFCGERFGVPEAELADWSVLVTLPPDDYGAKP